MDVSLALPATPQSTSKWCDIMGDYVEKNRLQLIAANVTLTDDDALSL